MNKVLSAIRNSNADNEKGTSAIRNAIKKHDTLYSGANSTNHTEACGGGKGCDAGDHFDSVMMAITAIRTSRLSKLIRS